MIATAIIGISMGVTLVPESIVSMPPSISLVFLKFEWQNIFTLDMVIVLFTLLFSPIFASITPAVTCSVLVLVGLFMIEPIKEIDIIDFTEAIPAFLTIIMMPLAYSISDGIVFGVISYIVLKCFAGKRKEISLTTVIVGIIFLLKF